MALCPLASDQCMHGRLSPVPDTISDHCLRSYRYNGVIARRVLHHPSGKRLKCLNITLLGCMLHMLQLKQSSHLQAVASMIIEEQPVEPRGILAIHVNLSCMHIMQ